MHPGHGASPRASMGAALGRGVAVGILKLVDKVSLCLVRPALLQGSRTATSFLMEFQHPPHGAWPRASIGVASTGAAKKAASRLMIVVVFMLSLGRKLGEWIVMIVESDRAELMRSFQVGVHRTYTCFHSIDGSVLHRCSSESHICGLTRCKSAQSHSREGSEEGSRMLYLAILTSTCHKTADMYLKGQANKEVTL